jgi:hypothetical protein
MAASWTTSWSLPRCDQDTKVVSTSDSSGSESHRKHVVARKLESLLKVGTSSGCGGVHGDASPSLPEAGAPGSWWHVNEDLVTEEEEVWSLPEETSRGLVF